MTYTYRFHVQPIFARGYGWPIPDLVAETFTNTLVGSVVKQLVATPDAGYAVHIALRRPTHEQALEELFTVVQSAGYGFLQATVTEWVTSAIEGALTGCAAGGALGARTKDGGTTLVTAIVGGLVGAGVGSLIETAKTSYGASRHFLYGSWTLTQSVPAAA